MLYDKTISTFEIRNKRFNTQMDSNKVKKLENENRIKKGNETFHH